MEQIFSQLPSISLKETKSPGSSNKASSHNEDRLIESAPEKKIICRQCGQIVTDASYSIYISENHEHSFFNPYGYIFQIRCFSSASGCIISGEPSSEFSWFAGYTWQITACIKCFTHLGWKFKSHTDSFYGLIKNNISEQY